MNKKLTQLISSRSRIFYGWYLVAIVWLISFLMGGSAVGIFFKPMLDDFGWTRAALSLVGAVAILVYAAVLPFMGRMIDRFGPRIMLLASVAFQALSNAILGVSSGIWSVGLGRFLGEIKPTHGSQVLINYWFEKKRGRALGIASTGIPLGTLVLSPVSQYLVLNWGWRNTLLGWSVLTAVVLLPLILLINNRPEQKGLAIDGESSVRELHIETRGNEQAISPQSGNATGKSLAEAVRMKAFWLLSTSQFICGIGCGLIMTHTVILATDLGYTEMIGASFLSIQGGVNLLGVLLTGQLSDRIARNKVLAVTHAIRSVSFLCTAAAILLSGSPLWMLFLAMALFGFGWFTTAPLAAGLAADIFGYKQMGTIIGLTMSFHTVGMAIGTYAGGITFQLTRSYLMIFLIQGVLELIAMACVFNIKSRSGSKIFHPEISLDC